MKRKSYSGIAAILAAMLLILGSATASNAQGSDHDQLVNDLKGIAAKAQSYYSSQGDSSFAGFALSASDTGNADGSFSINDGGMPSTDASYVPGFARSSAEKPFRNHKVSKTRSKIFDSESIDRTWCLGDLSRSDAFGSGFTFRPDL